MRLRRRSNCRAGQRNRLKISRWQKQTQLITAVYAGLLKDMRTLDTAERELILAAFFDQLSESLFGARAKVAALKCSREIRTAKTSKPKAEATIRFYEIYRIAWAARCGIASEKAANELAKDH